MSTTLVYVYWIDSAYTRQADDPKSFSPVMLHTIGWLVNETDECVVLAMEKQPEGEVYRDIVAIPHVAIVGRREQDFQLDTERP